MRDFLLFSAITLAWGGNWLFVKMGLETSPPFWLASIRFIIAFLSMSAIVLISKADYGPVKRNFWRIMLVGTLSYGVGYGLIHLGQGSVSAGTASVLFAAIPFFVAIFSLKFLPDERLDYIKVAGIAVGFAGIVVIYLGDISLQGPSALVGAGMITVSSATAAFTTVYIRRYLREVDPILLTHTQMIPGFVILFFFALLLEDSSAIQFNTNTVVSVLYLGLFGTAFSFWGFFYLLARVNAVKLSLIGFLTPVVALSLGWLFLGEMMSARFALGTVLVLCGVWFASRESAPRSISHRDQGNYQKS